jgi:hypothetical protein
MNTIINNYTNPYNFSDRINIPLTLDEITEMQNLYPSIGFADQGCWALPRLPTDICIMFIENRCVNGIAVDKRPVHSEVI